MNLGQFHIDETISGGPLLYVDIRGLGTVAIQRTDEGVLVDIFPLFEADQPVASCYAFESELIPSDEEDT